MTTTVKWQMGDMGLPPIEDPNKITDNCTNVDIKHNHRDNRHHTAPVDTKPLVAALRELDFNLQKSITKVSHCVGGDSGKKVSVCPSLGAIIPEVAPPFEHTAVVGTDYDRKDKVRGKYHNP